ncbi:MAG: rhomboid family intramembrane serine protease [Alphaproteobacteria bacterium]|nr:rhomboid family intramembrane serine protease [Alphaproteobacteria bacterium]
MLPLSDDNPHAGWPVVTWALIAACVIVYLWQATLPAGLGQQAVYALGMVPALLFTDLQLDPSIALVPAWATLITSMFLHGGLLHLGGNMLYMWIFADNVEVALGHVKFLAFYLLCGVAAALTQAFLDTESRIPMIGASGAISGVLGAYFLLFPRANVRVLMFPWGMVGVPAVVVLGLWFLLQLLDGVSATGGQGGVAFWAHVGGFLAGLALLPFFKPAHVPYFARGHGRAFRISRRDPKDGPWGRRR